MFNLLAGTYELAVDSTVLPPEVLGAMSPNYQEGSISATTQAGTITTPSGNPETSEFTFTLFLPKENAVEYLAALWPSAFNAPTSENQKTGNIEFGRSSCRARVPVPYHIHNICDDTDDNDIHIPAGLALIQFNPSLAPQEAVSVEITVAMQPDENGVRFRFGTGDLSQPSKYDATTQTTVPVTEPETEPEPAN